MRAFLASEEGGTRPRLVQSRDRFFLWNIVARSRSSFLMNHRHLFLLWGEARWCRTTARDRLVRQGYQRILWVGDNLPSCGLSIPASKVTTQLGSEWDALVFDAWSGFDPDAFGASLGAVRGGGVVILLAPSPNTWPFQPDPAMSRFTPWPCRATERSSLFLQRLARIVSSSATLRLFSSSGPPFTLPPPPAPRPVGTVCLTEDQEHAVDAICGLARGHRHRPLVLTADRGRGKSTALGIAAARLLRRGIRLIRVTAPSLEAAAVIFRQAERELDGSIVSPGKIRWQENEIRFEAPDRLCRFPEPANLLLVDEAAAIPVPLLTTLLKRHARIVFSTTVHGYEGTGRGFAIRFQETLQRLTPQWRALRLTEPVRWGENDPVERFGSHALLLKATPAPDRVVENAASQQCRWAVIPRGKLIADDPLLEELFGLLVLAHYRTRPSDLRNLLDGPTLTVHALFHDDHVVATALVIEEGELNEKLAEEVWLGQRRVRGHLLPQSLAAHAGFAKAARLRYARIMRLAVHPAARRRGLGKRLVEEVISYHRERGADGVGTSFGATPELLSFWYRAGFDTVHLGLRPEASSGHHAAFLLHPLTPSMVKLHRQLRHHLREQLPHLLTSPLRHLEPETVRSLLKNLPSDPESLNPHAQRDIHAFAFGHRGYETCAYALGKLTHFALAKGYGSSLSTGEQKLLVRKVLQNHPWGEVIRCCEFAGRRAALSALRGVMAKLIRAHPDLVPSLQPPPSPP